GKALGSFGAYVAGPRPVIDLLVNRARSFIFTTALPVPAVAGADAAVDIVVGEEGDRRREALRQRARQLRDGLEARGLPAPREPAHIVAIPVGDPRRAMALSEQLLERGIFIHGIRPPTVPDGASCLR